MERTYIRQHERLLQLVEREYHDGRIDQWEWTIRTKLLLDGMAAHNEIDRNSGVSPADELHVLPSSVALDLRWAGIAFEKAMQICRERSGDAITWEEFDREYVDQCESAAARAAIEEGT